MSHSISNAAFALASGLLLVASASPPSAAHGADRYPLVGPKAEVFCGSLDSLPGDAPDPGPGFVIFNNSGDRVSAVVVIRNAEPRTPYYVRLLQGPNDDCDRIDGVLTTNRHGNGTLRVTEPDVGDRAQVIIDTSSSALTATYRGAGFFSTN